MSLPFIQTKIRCIPYCSDLTQVFNTLCQQNQQTLLLESAEIESKDSVESLLIVRSAVKIKCESGRVIFTALTENGLGLLLALRHYFCDLITLIEVTDQQFQFICPLLDTNIDEEEKLHTFTPFEGLRAVMRCYSQSNPPVFVGGLFAYDLVMSLIPMENIILEDDGITCPDYCFYVAEQLVVIDHQAQQAELRTFCFMEKQQEILCQQAEEISQSLHNLRPVQPLAPLKTDVSTNLDDGAFKVLLANLKTHIYQGDVFQIVPSRRFSLACPHPLAAYRQLKMRNPSPYMFFMQDSEFTLFGASPESALKYQSENRQLEIYPIAGSRPRGFDENGRIDPDLDSRLELELRLDQKELSEHLMLVDLARNDMARVCESGSRYVKALMQVDRYSHIMHLVSKVVGTLRPEFDALHAYYACMNMGTLTGAPKTKAMQLLYQYEKQKRHSYGGAVGYLLSDGNFDSCIVIRSAFVQQGVAYVQAGCGQVLDSDFQREADETCQKAAAVIQAIVQTNQLAMNNTVGGVTYGDHSISR